MDKIAGIEPFLTHIADFSLFRRAPGNLSGGAEFPLLFFIAEGKIMFNNGFGLSDLHDFAMIQPENFIAHIQHCAGIVRHEDHRMLLHERPHELHALLRENDIPHGQSLINDQDIRVNMRNDGECQAHHHTAGIGFHRLINRLSDIGKCRNLLISGVDLAFCESQQGRVHIDILFSRKLRRETASKLQKRRYSAMDRHFSGSRLQRIGENLKQSAFPGSVHSDDSETLSGFHAEGNIVKRAEFTVEMPCPAEQSLHQAMHRSGIDFINFGEIAHFNADLIR